MKIIIEGAGAVGSHLAKMLYAESNTVLVIDSVESRLSNLSNSVDVETLLGNPTSISVLKRAGVQNADLFIAVVPFAPQETNILAAILAKQLGASKVAARLDSEEYLSQENKMMLKDMGIELVFYPEKNAADEIASSLRHTPMLDAMEFAHGKLQIAEFKMGEESQLLDMKISDIAQMVKPEDLGLFRIIAVSRANKTIIPTLNTKLQFGDIVFTISKQEGVKLLYKYFGKSNIATRRIMIFGGNSIAAIVARVLVGQGMSVKLLEGDKNRCFELTEMLPDAVSVVNADGRNSDVLYEEGIHDCDAFVALSDNDETNVLACVVAKKFGVPHTIAEVENLEYIRLAEEMGVNHVVNKKLTTAGRIFKFTLSGKARYARYMTGADAEVLEYTVQPGAPITSGPLKTLNFPHGAIIGGVIRGQEAFIAVGDTIIEPYDRVAIFAIPQTLKDIEQFFATK